MKLLLINVVCGVKSTGRICTDIADYMESKGHSVKIAYGRENVPERFKKYAVRIGTDFDVKCHGLKKLVLDEDGRGSNRATERFLEWVKDYDPDIIHLHNILGYYINIPILFEYLRASRKRVIWTLHDCSAFTGGCDFFEYVGCEKWKNSCGNCPQRGRFPKTRFVDRSAKKLKENRKFYGKLDDFIIVTPSLWLKEYVEQSFLNIYQSIVINNGVNTNVFYNRGKMLKAKLGIEEKKVILGVASPWSERKGLNDFIEIATILPQDKYQIFLVGLSEKQIKDLPRKIIGIKRTDSVEKLAEYYSMADIFVNPTYEDNYPTTNLEAIACGTPVLTYDTGGSGESARIYGCIVPKGNIKQLLFDIKHSSEVIQQEYSNSIRKMISIEHMVKKYLNLYEDRNI